MDGAGPLTYNDIQRIPDVEITVEQAVNQCSVCLEHYKIGENVKELPCCHIFHNQCITRWLKLKGTCPDCRHPLTPCSENALVTDEIETQSSILSISIFTLSGHESPVVLDNGPSNSEDGTDLFARDAHEEESSYESAFSSSSSSHQSSIESGDCRPVPSKRPRLDLERGWEDRHSNSDEDTTDGRDFALNDSAETSGFSDTETSSFSEDFFCIDCLENGTMSTDSFLSDCD